MLFARADQAQAAVAEDQERIDRLQKQIATEKDGRARDALQQRIDLTKAKLELDQDELETADLVRYALAEGLLEPSAEPIDEPSISAA